MQHLSETAKGQNSEGIFGYIAKVLAQRVIECFLMYNNMLDISLENA